MSDQSEPTSAALPADPSVPPYRVACDTYIRSSVTEAWVPVAHRIVTSAATSG